MTSLFSGKYDLESRRSDVIKEMEDRLKRVGDKLPVPLQIQMRESIAAYKHEKATGIQTEWTVIKGHHGCPDRAGQAGEQKYPKAKTTVKGGDDNRPTIDMTRIRYICGLGEIVPKDRKEIELKTTVVRGGPGHRGDYVAYTSYVKK